MNERASAVLRWLPSLGPKRSLNWQPAFWPRFGIRTISLVLMTWAQRVTWRSLTFLQGLGFAGVGVLFTLHLLASLVLSALTTGEARFVVCLRTQGTLGGDLECSLLLLLLLLLQNA